MLQYILSFVSQLSNYIPRPEFTGIMQKVRGNDITEVRSGLAEKFVMVVGKLTGLERRIEGLKTEGLKVIQGSGVNCMQELKNKVRDFTTECGNLRERNMSLEKELRDKVAIIDRLRSRMDQMDESLALNTVKITDLESQRGSACTTSYHA
jgi:predicted nuclease with TOPRIM domain